MPEDRLNHPRKIIHIDMDCFYAAVETRENPALKGRPVAVGGQPGQRGVVAACNYEAREFGVHSAMPMSIAVRCCRGLVRLPVRMELYRQVSAQIRKIFEDYTDQIEPLSLDEAFLDVSGVARCQGSASLMAAEIRQRIVDTTGLTASAGVGPNKLIAKIASDWQKPDGQTVITPEQVDEFIRPLPVKKIFGVGKVTTARLHRMGLHRCEDLQALSQEQLSQEFGSFGVRLYQQCRGIDERPVNNDRKSKSLSVEDTYVMDLPDLDTCIDELSCLFETLLQRLARAREKSVQQARKYHRDAQPLLIKTLFLKMRFSDFSTTTAQQGGSEPDLSIYTALCRRAYARGARPVRLLGVGVAFTDSDDEIDGWQSDIDSL